VAEFNDDDKILYCRDCGLDFIFSAREQVFYAQKGFQNDPTRCPECRAERKNMPRENRPSFAPRGNGGNYQQNNNRRDYNNSGNYQNNSGNYQNNNRRDYNNSGNNQDNSGNYQNNNRRDYNNSGNYQNNSGNSRPYDNNRSYDNNRPNNSRPYDNNRSYDNNRPNNSRPYDNNRSGNSRPYDNNRPNNSRPYDNNRSYNNNDNSGNFNRGGYNNSSGDQERKTYEVTCANCGIQTEVNFVPREGSAVYCRKCYNENRQRQYVSYE
jgi:CxxC-x17-CxxC domain-containing protein